MFFRLRHAGFHHAGWELVGSFTLLVLVAVLIGVVVYTSVRSTRGAAAAGAVTAGPPFGRPPVLGPGGPDPALEQVRYRYARGELSRDEYFRLARDLGWGPGPPAGPPPGAGPGSAGSPPGEGEPPTVAGPD